MDKKKILIIGAVAVGAIALYYWNKNKDQKNTAQKKDEGAKQDDDKEESESFSGRGYIAMARPIGRHSGGSAVIR